MSTTELSVYKKLPFWSRVFNIIFGLINSILAFYLVLNYEVAFLTILVLFIVIVLISGFVRIMDGLFNQSETRNFRVLNVIFGLIVLLTGLYILTIDPVLGVELIIFLLSFSLIVSGTIRIIIGIGDKLFPVWARIILLIVGIISVVLAFYVLASPTVGIELLILALAIGFLFNGIGRFVTGLTGWQEIFTSN